MTRFTRSLIAAATLAALASTGLAQTRVDRSGANDANNRIGSNGRNEVGTRQNPWDIQNNIVYGNISGGKQFRGNVTTFDNQAFQGRTGQSSFDNFVRDSSSVTTGGVATYNASQTHAYYGDSRAVPPPAGFVGVRTTGGYSPPVPTAWNSIDPRGATVGTNTVVNRPDQFLQPGPVDSIYAPGATAAPFTQGGAINGSNLSDYTSLNTTTVSQLTPGQIKQIQSDSAVSQIPGQTPQTNGTNPVEAGSQPQPAGGNPQATPGNRASQRPQIGLVTSGLNQPAAQTPDASAQDYSAPDSSVSNAAPSNGTGNAPEAGLVTRMVPRTGQPTTPQTNANTNVGLPNTPAARPGQTAEQAARDYNTALRKQQAGAVGTPDAQSDAKAQPYAGAQPAAPGHPASGAPMKGLGDLLTKANDLVKTGKYASAIDTYTAAEALAPGNAQIRLGRANAELGGAYYRRAAISLRAAAKADPKAVATQIDLRTSLGDDRLTAVQKDLSDLVQKAPTDTGPAVLLAYVYYNTGNERRATALLDLADQRAGGRDPLVTQLKTAWGGAGGETK